MKAILNYFLIFLLLLIANNIALSQTTVATVIISNGENMCGKEGNFRKIKIGSSLLSGELLKLSQNGYIALLTTSGSTIELKSSDGADYNIDEIVSGNDSELSLVKKYTNYIVSKMAPEEMENNRKRYASIAGAVERNIGISAYLNKTSELYEPFAIIRWDPSSGKPPYHISVQDNYGNQLLSSENNNNYIRIDFSNKNLEKVDIVVISIKDADGLSNEYSIQRVSKKEDTNFGMIVSELKSSLDDDSAFENLILAEFYEQNNLTLDASTCFEKAMILEPQVTYFRDAYKEFLMRNNFGELID